MPAKSGRKRPPNPPTSPTTPFVKVERIALLRPRDGAHLRVDVDAGSGIDGSGLCSLKIDSILAQTWLSGRDGRSKRLFWSSGATNGTGYRPEKQAAHISFSPRPKTDSIPSSERYPRESASMKVRISSSSLRGRDQLLSPRGVDPVVTRVERRRRGDTHVDLGRAGALEQTDELLRRRPADDGVVHQDDPLASDDGPDGVQLHLDAEVTDRLLRLDERAPHVVVPHEPHAVRDAALLRVPERGEDAGVGDRDDDVGGDRVLAREALTESPLRLSATLRPKTVESGRAK